MAETLVPESAAPAKRRGRTTHAERVERRRQEYLARKATEDAENRARLDAIPLKFGVCYFFGAAEGIVKIGYSRDVLQRLSKIQSTSMYRLDLLAVAPGGRTREKLYHNRFEAHALGAEWFERHPDIEAEIALLNERFPLDEMLLSMDYHPQDCERLAAARLTISEIEA